MTLFNQDNALINPVYAKSFQKIDKTIIDFLKDDSIFERYLSITFERKILNSKTPTMEMGLVSDSG